VVAEDILLVAVCQLIRNHKRREERKIERRSDHLVRERMGMSNRDIFKIMMLSLIYIVGVITGLLAQISR
jgi:hypothetical protein